MDERIFKADISVLIMFIMLADKCIFKRWEEELSLKIFVLSVKKEPRKVIFPRLIS